MTRDRAFPQAAWAAPSCTIAAMPRRSYLFVPGNRPDRYDKAWSARAGAVIVDLEDAVAPAEKLAARDALARWLSVERPVMVRVNAAGSVWFDDDLRACAHDAVAAIVLPKAESADEIARVAAAGDVGHRADADGVLPGGDHAVAGAVDRHERGRGRRLGRRAHVRPRGSGGVGGTAGGDGGGESGEGEEQRDAHECHTCEIGCKAHRLSERG